MSAENLSPRQFHGTDLRLKPGDKLTPRNELSYDPKGSTNFGGSQHGSWVWTTQHPNWASGFGAHVYEVEHEGLSNAPDTRYAPIPGSRVGLGAKVIRKVNLKDPEIKALNDTIDY